MHIKQHAGSDRLSDLVDSHQSRGRYVLTRKQALRALDVSDEALKKSARRLVAKRRLAVPRRGFFVIVPVEYREAGAPPPSWFIDDLMKFIGQPYYVGLLSAAALHGAAHQQPQEFHIISGVPPLRTITSSGAVIRFFAKRNMPDTGVVEKKTDTGIIKLSSPELTSIDLVAFTKRVGGINRVVDLLSELAPMMMPEDLGTVALRAGSIAVAQRLGYVLEVILEHRILADALFDALGGHALFPVALVPGARKLSRKRAGSTRWHVDENATIAADI